ncbi:MULTISPECIES: hypothetical protein [Romboutsia]|uniref:hypothetical protein n=1 Tax=Romboutsia TaxID=1501226 RepID=UPI0021737E9A|nr:MULTISPECIES: hypothetical protein [Romboutsia]MCI9062033.1 hypothetical protein [Romboutsia sp.]MCI9259873.1 hypothetical protein [Romboutsia sp.]
MIKINNKIKITFKNGFVRIIERDNIRNFNSLVDWLEKFNKGEEVPFLTMSGRDLGSAIAINKNNIKSIEFINK